MGSRTTIDDEREAELDREVERYRKAATYAVEQLDWVVGYLHRIRRPEIAAVLDRNSKQIKRSIR